MTLVHRRPAGTAPSPPPACRPTRAASRTARRPRCGRCSCAAAAACRTPTSAACARPTRTWRCATPATSTPAARRACRSGSSAPTDDRREQPRREGRVLRPGRRQALPAPDVLRGARGADAPVSCDDAVDLDTSAYCLRLGDDALVLGQRLCEWAARVAADRGGRRAAQPRARPARRGAQPADPRRRARGRGPRRGRPRVPARRARLHLRAAVRGRGRRLRPHDGPPAARVGLPAAAVAGAVAPAPTRCSRASRARRSRRRPTTSTTRAAGSCGSATAPRSRTAACRPASTRCGRTPSSCSSATPWSTGSSPAASPPTPTCCGRSGRRPSREVLAEATLEVPQTTWRPTGGRTGRHLTSLRLPARRAAAPAPQPPGRALVTHGGAGCARCSRRCTDPEIPVITIEDLGILRDVAGRGRPRRRHDHADLLRLPGDAGDRGRRPRGAAARARRRRGAHRAVAGVDHRLDDRRGPRAAAGVRHRPARAPAGRPGAACSSAPPRLRLPAVRLGATPRSSPGSARRRARRCGAAVAAASRSTTSGPTEVPAATEPRRPASSRCASRRVDPLTADSVAVTFDVPGRARRALPLPARPAPDAAPRARRRTTCAARTRVCSSAPAVRCASP